MSRSTQLELEVLPQPDDSTCGPTCLHAVYRYWGANYSLDQIISEITPLPEGGTLAVSLACHALSRGFAAEIYTYNLQIFDPTWFPTAGDLAHRLMEQQKAKGGRKLTIATDAYLDFLRLGGKVRYTELSPELLERFLHRDVPILTGLSATYLYGCARERENRSDDVRGRPVGHFVVLSGYDHDTREATVADPLHDNPRYASRYYRVGVERLISSILLGILTYDANLLVITPKEEV